MLIASLIQLVVSLLVSIIMGIIIRAWSNCCVDGEACIYACLCPPCALGMSLVVQLND